MPEAARRCPSRRGVAARDHRSRRRQDGGRGAPGRRRRLPEPAVLAHGAAGPRPRRRACGAAALGRHAAARADGQRPGRDLSLGVARRPHAGPHQRRDRAHLGLPAGELHRQRQADDHEHRPPRRPRAGVGGGRPGRGHGPGVRRRVPDRARRRRDPLGARPRPAGARSRRAALDGRGDLRHHRAARGRGGAAPARGRGRPHRRVARLADPDRRGRRRGQAEDRARPPRRRPAAPRDAGARRAGGTVADRARARVRGAVPRAPRRRALSRRRRSCASSPAASTPRC